jgi:hypothetical protein
VPVVLATQEAEIRKIIVQSQSWQVAQAEPILKIPTQKKAGGVGQVVEHLPSKCETLSSNSSNCQKEKNVAQCNYYYFLVLLSLNRRRNI